MKGDRTMIERLKLHLQDLLDTVIESEEHNYSWVKDDKYAFDTAMLTANIAMCETGKRFARYGKEIIVVEL